MISRFLIRPKRRFVGVAGLPAVILKGVVAQLKARTLPRSVAFLFSFHFQSFALSSFKQKSQTRMSGCCWSGWQDSNMRPPAPKAGAITGLRYTPKVIYKSFCTTFFNTLF